MKKIILLLFLAFCFNTSYSQLNMFGIDISKHISYGSDVYYKKFVCSGNPYFTIAEYKDMLGMKFILFDDYTAKSKTPQMKDPDKYLPELKKYISKSFGQSISLYSDSSLTNIIPDEFLFVKQYKDKYLVGTLGKSSTRNRNDFRIIIYGTKDEMIKGVQFICGGEYSWRVRYYDKKLFDKM